MSIGLIEFVMSVDSSTELPMKETGVEHRMSRQIVSSIESVHISIRIDLFRLCNTRQSVASVERCFS